MRPVSSIHFQADGVTKTRQDDPQRCPNQSRDIDVLRVACELRLIYADTGKGGANGTPRHIQHSPNTPNTGLRERGNDTSKSTGRSGRQNAATRRNMRREERVTVRGSVKKQQPDGMPHGGGGHVCCMLTMLTWCLGLWGLAQVHMTNTPLGVGGCVGVGGCD